MENRGKPWETMGNRGKPWETMGNRGKPWETVGSRGILHRSDGKRWEAEVSSKDLVGWETVGNGGKPGYPPLIEWETVGSRGIRHGSSRKRWETVGSRGIFQGSSGKRWETVGSRGIPHRSSRKRWESVGIRAKRLGTWCNHRFKYGKRCKSCQTPEFCDYSSKNGKWLSLRCSSFTLGLWLLSAYRKTLHLATTHAAVCGCDVEQRRGAHLDVVSLDNTNRVYR